MDEKRLRGLMGLCVRAGQGVFGEDGCLGAVRGGKAAILLMDGEISPLSAERYEKACEREHIPVFMIPAGLLEEATGRPGMAMAVKPGGFADQIRSLFSI